MIKEVAVVVSILASSNFVGMPNDLATAKLGSASTDQSLAQAKVACPKCKKLNPSTNRFCEFCGTAIENSTSSSKGIQELGGTIVCLANFPSVETDPSWSPKGNRIAYASNRFNEAYGLCMMNDKGAPVSQGGHVWIDGPVSWSSDGEKFIASCLMESNYNVCSFDRDALNKAVISRTSDNQFNPSWSKKTGLLAFDQYDRVGSVVFHQIFVKRKTDSKPHSISDGTAGDWDPDYNAAGTKIAFISNREGRMDGPAQLGAIYSMDADGANVRKLTGVTGDDESPCWSPDGKRIAFDSKRDGNRDIYVMDADGFNLQRLTNDPGIDAWPSWSPDGKRIAYASDRSGNGDIYVMTLK